MTDAQVSFIPMLCEGERLAFFLHVGERHQETSGRIFEMEVPGFINGQVRDGLEYCGVAREILNR